VRGERLRSGKRGVLGIENTPLVLVLSLTSHLLPLTFYFSPLTLYCTVSLPLIPSARWGRQ
jgi:hypothetical protein